MFGGGGGGGSDGSGGVAVRLPGTINGLGILGSCAVNTRNDGSGVFGGTRSGGDKGWIRVDSEIRLRLTSGGTNTLGASRAAACVGAGGACSFTGVALAACFFSSAGLGLGGWSSRGASLCTKNSLSPMRITVGSMFTTVWGGGGGGG